MGIDIGGMLGTKVYFLGRQIVGQQVAQILHNDVRVQVNNQQPIEFFAELHINLAICLQ